MNGADLRAVARRCRELSYECLDLTVAGKLRRLGENLEARAIELDEAPRASRVGSRWAALRRWMRQIRLPFWERLRTHGAHH